MEKEIEFIEMPEGIEIAERLLEFEKDKKKKMICLKFQKTLKNTVELQ